MRATSSNAASSFLSVVGICLAALGGEAARTPRTPERPDEFVGRITLKAEGVFTTQLMDEPEGRFAPPPCEVCRSDRPADVVTLSPGFDANLLRPTNPPTVASALEPFGDRAPNDLNVWRNTTGFIGGPPLVPAGASITTNEPSLGQVKNVVFWTGNTYAAISRNGGVTWQYINPSLQFPAPPAADADCGAAP